MSLAHQQGRKECADHKQYLRMIHYLLNQNRLKLVVCQVRGLLLAIRNLCLQPLAKNIENYHLLMRIARKSKS